MFQLVYSFDRLSAMCDSTELLDVSKSHTLLVSNYPYTISKCILHSQMLFAVLTSKSVSIEN